MNLSRAEAFFLATATASSLARASSLWSSRLLSRSPVSRTPEIRRVLWHRAGWGRESPRIRRESFKMAVTASDGDREPRRRPCWMACPKCHGEGKTYRSPSRKARLQYKRAKLGYEAARRPIGPGPGCRDDNDHDKDDQGRTSSEPPKPPQLRVDPCPECSQTGIVQTLDGTDTKPDLNLPHVAIIGGGLGGLALAIACRHRSIPCTVYERDGHFSQRSQGYGLTMQQASRALPAFGIHKLKDGQTSTKHVVHQPDGTVVGEWGLRKWGRDQNKASPKRQNIHIARQSLRWELLQALGGENSVQWNHKLITYAVKPEQTDGHQKLSPDEVPRSNRRMEMKFQISPGKFVTPMADLIVGADGIRSSVRSLLIGDESSPLRYLGCLVILGICPLDTLNEATQGLPLLDGQTVFQTADGSTRLYSMPFSDVEYMWQLSYPVQDEAEAKTISSKGVEFLKAQAIEKCKTWHEPIPELLQRTPSNKVSGYPVYDRELISADMLHGSDPVAMVTLLGDAAHPMSPFKGQGANQALLDALSLARAIYKKCHREGTSANEALEAYHEEMTARSATKVSASADAARFLHTKVAIQKGDITRGAAATSTPHPASY